MLGILNQFQSDSVRIEQLAKWIGFRSVAYVRRLFMAPCCHIVPTMHIHNISRPVPVLKWRINSSAPSSLMIPSNEP